MAQMKKIRVAFLGGGVNSAVGKTHKIAIEMDKKYELVAGCFSRNLEVNHETALEYNIPINKIYQNLAQLIENEKENVDAIIILTPTPNHKNEVIECIKHAIPVICEKALAVSSEEALEIQKALQQYNGFLAVTYNYTGYPMLRELKDMIANYKLGKIEQVHIEMPQEGFLRLDEKGEPIRPQAWRLIDDKLPMISLDLGTHTHDIISFLTLEKPLELVAVESSLGAFKEIVDNVTCMVNYTNDLICNIWYSKTTLGNRNGLRVRVYGEEGSAEWYQLEPEILYFNNNKGQKFIIDRASADIKIASEQRYNRFKAGHPSGFIEAFANYYSDIADCLNEKTIDDNTYVYGISNALEGLQMLEAISKSSKNREWVEIK